MNVKNGSAGFPAQVCTVTDTDGTIHPVWVKYQDPEDGLVAIKINEVKKQSPDYKQFSISHILASVFQLQMPIKINLPLYDGKGFSFINTNHF